MIAMNVRPEERPKLIVLSVAVGLLVVYFIFVMLPRLAVQAHPPMHVTPIVAGATQTNAPAAPSQPTAGGLPTSSTIWSLERASEQKQAMAPRDPFVPLKVPEALSAPVVSRNPHLPHVQSPSIRNLLPAVPAAQPNPAVARVTAPIGVQAATAPTLQNMGIELNGVMPDYPPMAIFRIGDQTVYKHEGDHLSQDLVILRITEAGVQLRRGRAPIPLLLVGQTLPGLPANANPIERGSPGTAPSSPLQ